MGDEPGAGVVARFWLRWMSCRLFAESVDMNRVKKQCDELRRTLKVAASGPLTSLPAWLVEYPSNP